MMAKGFRPSIFTDSEEIVHRPARPLAAIPIETLP